MTGILLLLQLAAPPPDFDAFAKAFRAACAVEAGPTNREQKAAAFETADCARERMEEELDRLLVPLRTGYRDRFDALMREQAAWNRFEETGCALVEEMEWVEVETGEVTFGTASGYALAGCQEQARLERAYFAAALREGGGTAGLVERVRTRAAEGEKTRAALRAFRDGVSRWITTPAKTESELFRALTADDARRLREAALAVERQAGALARPLCRNWPALREGLGGQEACVRASGAYLLQHLR
jgi:hypothetical protein